MNIQLIIVAITLVLVESRKKHGKHGHGRHSRPGPVRGGGFDLAKFMGRVFQINIGGNAPGAAQAGETCADIADWCSEYKSYCSYASVKKYCKVTCNICPKTVVEVGCKDTHSSCQNGLKYNYCTGNRAQINFMKKYCRKSCKFCEEKAKCIDTHRQGSAYCTSVKKGGYCQKKQYRIYFKENCAKTCGYCGDKSNHKCGVAHLRSGPKKQHIVGGVDAEKGFYPWQAAIYYNSKFLCGGTLINKRYILTAAHCFIGRGVNVINYKIVLGEHNRKFNEDTEETYFLENIKIHESYSKTLDDHDIALMKINKDVEFNDHIHPACLPNTDAVVKIGSQCFISGWGKQYIDEGSVDTLQELKVPVVDNSVCEVRNAFNFHKVTNKMICTGTDDGSTYNSACHGDSGGPLSCELSPGVWTLVGVVSWGSPLCNGLDRYTVFTRVSSYRNWINKSTS